MIRNRVWAGLALPLLAAGCTEPPPYRLGTVPYYPVVVMPPRESAYTAPIPPSYEPVTAVPLPGSVPRDPVLSEPALSDPEPAPVVSAPVEPAADAPRDTVEDMLLKPMGTPAPASAAPEKVATPQPDNAAVPLMGFRPMRGQKPAP